MSDRKYSRVYWSVKNDDRFVGIYRNDAHFATWVRLLMAADAVWPHPADLPRRAKPSSVKALVDAGIIELLPNDMYRVHGLDRERTSRGDAAAVGARKRWDSERNANALQTESDTNAIRDETRRDEPNQDEPYVVAWFNVTGRAPSPLQRQKLYELYDRHHVEWLVDNLPRTCDCHGRDPLGHAFDADTAWRRAETERVKAEEAAVRREKERQRKLDRAALMRMHPEDAA